MINATDCLFAFQIITALLLGVPQALTMIESTQGMTLVLYVCVDTFIFFNLLLAHQAHAEVPSRETKQTLIIYYVWLVVISTHLVILSIFGKWTSTDSVATFFLIVLSALVIAWQKLNGKGIKDAMTRGYLALCAKSVPQLYLAFCIFRDGGGDGLGAWFVWGGHIAVLTRIAILVKAGNKSNWNRNIVGSLVSESGNEISWIVVTIVWLIT